MAFWLTVRQVWASFSLVMAEYPEKDFPWTFYFNGVAMPKWGANWPTFNPGHQRNWDWDIGPRDFYIVCCKIDHVGSIESANAHAFLYSVQEVLCMLFTERENVLKDIQHRLGTFAEPLEIFNGVAEAAFKMRELVRRDGHAFWTSGYQDDQVRLMEAIRRASLAHDDPQFQPPPHIRSRSTLLQQLWKDQVKILHAAAAVRGLDKEHRKKLLEL